MDQRRLLLFIILSMSIWLIWINYFVPKLIPQRAANIAKIDVPDDPMQPADALHPANVFSSDEPKLEEKKQAVEIPRHPIRSVWIGPTKDDPDPKKLAEFFLAARLNTRGASIEAIQLTDINRYPAFNHRGERLNLVNGTPSGHRTFGLRIPEIDKLLDNQPLDQISWEIAEETSDSITFRLQSPDGVWEVTKQFRLRKLTDEEQKRPHIRNTFVEGYEVTLTIGLKNLSNNRHKISYVLQGPTGVPLEDKDNTYKYRDIRMGFLRDDGVTVDDNKMAASDVVKKENAGQPVIWRRPHKYIGIDVAYFAAIVLPSGENKLPSIDSSKAVVGEEAKDGTQYSDISVELTSKELDIEAHARVENKYVLYVGPKQKQLLQQIGAGAAMDYGWFDSICLGMVWILNAFHAAGLSYGLAIICLTILVRTLLIPISRHQAMHAAKMKELQPKIMARQKELEERHGKNTEEYIKASQELVAEQSKMMLGGCLPMFLQLPIFIALYRSLGSSIELRMEPFLWFENLAAPDALFPFPFGFKFPFLGWTEFNLLPCISIGLMMLQQKLTMPAAQTKEQAEQYKMMNIMMFVMGATFYRVPAGLCLYFIMTNVWSMTERWIFERQAERAKNNPPPEPPPPPPSGGNKTPPEPAPEGWFQKLKNSSQDLLQQLQDAADKDTSIRRTDRNDPDDKIDSDGRKNSNGKPGKGGKKRGKR